LLQQPDLKLLNVMLLQTVLAVAGEIFQITDVMLLQSICWPRRKLPKAMLLQEH
jgi:hypothetical protein